MTLLEDPKELQALEQRARSLAQSLNLNWVAELRASVRKQALAAEVSLPSGQRAILKCYLGTASQPTSKEWVAERDFYREVQFGLAPRALDTGASYILLERVEGVTLRRWLGSADFEFERLLLDYDRIFDALAARRCANTQPTQRPAALCADRVYNLLISGPLDARRSRLGATVAAQVSRVWVPTLRRAMAPVYARWQEREVQLASEFGHNDLHPNNVLVGKQGLWVVDYERLTKPGFWHIDVLYLFGTIYSGLREPEQRSRLFDHVLRRLEDAEPAWRGEVRYLLKVFAGAALSNGRFRGSTWYDQRNLGTLLKLFAR